MLESFGVRYGWVKFRIFALVIAVIVGPFIVVLYSPEGGVGKLDLIVIFIGTVLSGLLVAMMVVFNPLIPKRRISWHVSPFDYRSSHLYFHFLSLEIMAGAGGAFVWSLIRNDGNEPSAAFFFLLGAGIRLGLFIGMFPFRSRFRE